MRLPPRSAGAATQPRRAAAARDAPAAGAWGKLLVVGLGTIVVPLDSAVNIDFPAIVAHFGLPIPMIQWIVIAYVLTQTSLMLSFGRIGDMLGYRRVFLAGSAVSTLAFLGCAMAPSYAALVAARVVQGVGASLLLSCGPALATSLFPEAMRAQVLGRYMAMFGIGAALGPSVFGVLVSRFGWTAVFGFRAPVAALAMVLGWVLLRQSCHEPGRIRLTGAEGPGPEPDPMGLTRTDGPASSPTRHPGGGSTLAPGGRRASGSRDPGPASRPPDATREPFDALGGLLLAASLSGLLLTLNQLRAPGPGLGVSAGAAAAGFWLFWRQEQRAARPIIDFAYFRMPGFRMINVAHAAINLAAFSIMLLAPFQLGRLPGLSLSAAGLALAASPAGTVVAAPLAGRMAQGMPGRSIALAGAALSSLGLLGIAFAPALAWMVAAMAVQGVGMGLFQVAYFDIVTGAIPARHRGVAGALGMATRSIGTVMGATVLMLVFSAMRDSGLGFALAFRATFALAGCLSAAVALLLALRRG